MKQINAGDINIALECPASAGAQPLLIPADRADYIASCESTGSMAAFVVPTPDEQTPLPD